MTDAIDILKDKKNASNERLDALLDIVEQFEDDDFLLLEDILCDSKESLEVRCAVALALGKIADEKSVAILKLVAEEDDPLMRHYVMQALGMTHQEAAAPILINALKDKSNDVFAAASEALGALGEIAIPFLIDLLSTGADDARCIAAWQLGELGSAKAVPALVKTIQSKPNVSVIALCIWALGEIGMGSEEALSLLTQARQEPEPDVRLRAETAIKKIVRHSN